MPTRQSANPNFFVVVLPLASLQRHHGDNGLTKAALFNGFEHANHSSHRHEGLPVSFTKAIATLPEYHPGGVVAAYDELRSDPDRSLSAKDVRARIAGFGNQDHDTPSS